MKLFNTNFFRRLQVAVVGIPIIGVILVVGSVPLFLFISLLAIVSLFEISKMLNHANVRLFPTLFVPLNISIIYLVSQVQSFSQSFVLFGTMIVLITTILIIYFYSVHLNRFLKNISITVIATILISVPLSFAILIYQLPQGALLLATIIFGVFSFDTGAYIFGNLLGKNKMAPVISPNKTWEGAFFGTIICFITVGILDMIFDLHIDIFVVIVMACIITVFGQIGDFAESYFKRRMKSKDSSKLLPGHGGFLDRIDSIVIVLPAVYYWVLLWV